MRAKRALRVLLSLCILGAVWFACQVGAEYTLYHLPHGGKELGRPDIGPPLLLFLFLAFALFGLPSVGEGKPATSGALPCSHHVALRLWAMRRWPNEPEMQLLLEREDTHEVFFVSVLQDTFLGYESMERRLPPVFVLEYEGGRQYTVIPVETFGLEIVEDAAPTVA